MLLLVDKASVAVGNPRVVLIAVIVVILSRVCVCMCRAALCYLPVTHNGARHIFARRFPSPTAFLSLSFFFFFLGGSPSAAVAVASGLGGVASLRGV